MAKKKATRPPVKKRVVRAKKKAKAPKRVKAPKRAKAAALSGKAQLERNKKVVITFYNTIMNKKDFNEAVKLIGNDYLQHNPTANSGIEGLREWMEGFHTAYPELHSIVRRVVAEDDIVVLHNESKNGPGGHRATVDIFRVKNGKIIEHWDVIQVIPATSMNNNTMF